MRFPPHRASPATVLRRPLSISPGHLATGRQRGSFPTSLIYECACIVLRLSKKTDAEQLLHQRYLPHRFRPLRRPTIFPYLTR